MASTSVVFDIIARDQASAKFNTLGNRVNDSTSKMSKFNSAMRTAGRAAAYGLGAGLVIAAGAAVKFVEAAAQDEQAADLLSGALKRNADATDEQVSKVEEWITAIGRAKGVTDDELRPALARLVTATGDVTQAQLLAQVAMDTSAATGKSLEAVSTALMKAQNGQVSSLSRLGINTKNAAGETISMNEAVTRMSEQFGGAATEKANTFAGKIGRLKLMLSEAGESIGSVLLPYATQFADWIIAEGIPKLEKFIHQFENGRGEGGRFRDRLEEVWGAIKKVTNWAADHKEDIVKLAAAFLVAKEATRAWTTAQIALNIALSANPIGIVILSVVGLSAAYLVAYNRSEKFRESVAKSRGVFLMFTLNAYGFAAALSGKVLAAIANVTDYTNRWKDRIDSLIGSVQSLVDWLGNIKMPDLKFPSKPGWLDRMGAGGGQGIDVGDAGATLIDSIVKGISKGKVKLDTALEKLKGYISKHMENLSSLLDQRQGILDSFAGFAGNIFSTNLSVGEGEAPKTIQALLDAGQAGRNGAEGLLASVKTLIGKGLSRDLLDDLMSAGSSGMEQIQLLATGTNEQIAQANADNLATQQALQEAGLAASAAQGVEAAIAQEQANLLLADSVKQGLKELLDEQDKNTVVELHLDGHKILWSLKKIKRQNGGHLGLGDRDSD
jgi:hypothetical protein